MAQFFFANALDNDHGRLARHLVILDRICRGELLPRTLAPTVPSLCTRSTLLRGRSRRGWFSRRSRVSSGSMMTAVKAGREELSGLRTRFWGHPRPLATRLWTAQGMAALVASGPRGRTRKLCWASSCHHRPYPALTRLAARHGSSCAVKVGSCQTRVRNDLIPLLVYIRPSVSPGGGGREWRGLCRRGGGSYFCIAFCQHPTIYTMVRRRRRLW